MKRLAFVLYFTFFIFYGFTALAQTGTVRGFVYDEDSGEPIIFTNVFVEGLQLGAATDVNGYFVITNVPVGTHELVVKYIGYEELRKEVTIDKPKSVLNLKLYIKESSLQLEGIQVSAEREEARNETRTSVVKISPKQIKQLPSMGGQPDLAQYLQVVPGVVFTGDQGGELYIRGGSPIQNKVLLDGMTIVNPFHSIGLFSVFETEFIRSADIYTGGFNAEYGGRISSIMDIRTREGNKNNYKGKLSGSTLGANVLVEGPIFKTNKDGASTSVLLAAKKSYLKEMSKLLYSYIDEDGLPFNFTDVYGKVTLAGKNGSKANIFGFNFNDRVDNFQALTNYAWNSFGGGFNFIIIPGSSPALMEGGLAGSKYNISMDNETMKAPKTSSVSSFDLSFKTTYFIGKHSFKFGVIVSSIATEYSFRNKFNNDVQRDDNATDLALFAKGKMNMGKLLLEPGLRLQYYSSVAYPSIEPRLAFKYNITDFVRFKAAAGIYSQNLSSLRSQREVVNLFTGFLGSIQDVPNTFRGERVKNKSVQKAQHIIAGVEVDFWDNLMFNVEAYLKNFSLLNSLNRNKIYNNLSDNPDAPEYLYLDFVLEEGKAYGFDFSLKYNPGRFYLWTVYSLGYVTRDDELTHYYPHFDRRHNVNVVTSYMAGRKRDWEISFRWNFGSGFPYTLVSGFLGTVPFNGINVDYTTANEELTLIYGDYNTARLPYYHRLDFNVKKTFKISKTSSVETDFSVTNLYDRKNIFYVNRVTGEKVYQLPIMPTFGVTYRF